MAILVLIGMVFVLIWEVSHGRISLNLVILLLLVIFVIEIRLELMYISIIYTYIYRKYQVKPHWSPWFSAAFTDAIVHRNHFIRLYQKDKSSDSKVKFTQASSCCKRVANSFVFIDPQVKPMANLNLFWKILNWL